jgi:hypothetical protein
MRKTPSPATPNVFSSLFTLPSDDDMALFSGRLQLPIALRLDRLLTPSPHGFRRDVADGAVQADVGFDQDGSERMPSSL